MSQPVHEEDQRRRRQYESEARRRKIRARWTPWTQHLPFALVAFGPTTLALAGCLAAICGAGAWAMIGPAAAAAFHLAAQLRDVQRFYTSRTILFRIVAAGAGLLAAAAGAALLNWSTYRAVNGLGWTLTTLGVWGIVGDILTYASLVILPPPKPEPANNQK
jgi:hypothetical protein